MNEMREHLDVHRSEVRLTLDHFAGTLEWSPSSEPLESVIAGLERRLRRAKADVVVTERFLTEARDLERELATDRRDD